MESIPSEISQSFAIITEAIGEKFSNVIFSAANVISGLAIALYRGPDFAAVCLAYFPLIILFITIFRKKVKESS